MRAGLSLGRPLTAALLAAFVPATMGLWGPILIDLPGAAPGPDPESEGWLAAPIEPIRSAHIGAAVPHSPHDHAGAGRNPFSVARKSDGRPLAAIAVQPLGAGRRAAAYPRLHAIIRVGGEQAALLDDQIVRAGDRIAGVEVLQVESRRVLVRGSTGSRWLELAASTAAPLREEP